MSHDTLWDALVEIAEQGAVPEARPGPHGLSASEARTALGRGQVVQPPRALVDALELPEEPSFRVTVPIRNRRDELYGLDFQVANGNARLLRVLHVRESDFADLFARVDEQEREPITPPPLPDEPAPGTALRLGVTAADGVRSRVGGVPFAPAGFEWPRRESGRPLAFLAQLDLRELPPSDLPPDGTLACFYDAATQPWDEGFQVLYWPASEPLAVTQPPDDLEPAQLVPQQGLAAAEAVVLQLLGDPDAIQEDPRQGDELLLWQLDGDPLDLDLYDAGRLYFLISPDDLAERRFERVRMVLQSY